MPSVGITTYRDLTEHLLDFMGASPGGDAARDARRAAQNGLATLARSHLWTYYQARGRIVTVPAYSTGTIAYNASTRVVTLTDGTWPTWAALGDLRFQAGDDTPAAEVVYQVASRVSDSTLLLSASSNPGVNVASGTEYTLYRDTYPLPIDCTTIDQAYLVGQGLWLCFEPPGGWLAHQQLLQGPSTPRSYTVRGDPDYMGVMSLSLFPAPDTAYALEFTYNRQPRALKTEAYSTGKVSVTSGQVAVTGVGTAWDSCVHAGCVIRFSADATKVPTSDVGDSPALFERVVVSVESATALTIDAPAPSTVSGVKHLLSDPADVEPLAMRLALFRACEFQLAISRQRKDKEEIQSAFQAELIRAREADARSFASEAAGGSGGWRMPMRYMPLGPDS